MPLHNAGCVCALDYARLWRSAEPDRDAMVDWKIIGIQKIFKLNGELEDPVHDPEMQIISRPLHELLRYDQVDEVIKICREIRGQMEQGRTCLVHCSHGRDRTGLVCAAYCLIYYAHTNLELVNEINALYGEKGIMKIIDAPDQIVLKEILKRKGLGHDFSGIH